MNTVHTIIHSVHTSKRGRCKYIPNINNIVYDCIFAFDKHYNCVMNYDIT